MKKILFLSNKTILLIQCCYLEFPNGKKFFYYTCIREACLVYITLATHPLSQGAWVSSLLDENLNQGPISILHILRKTIEGY